MVSLVSTQHSIYEPWGSLSRGDSVPFRSPDPTAFCVVFNQFRTLCPNTSRVIVVHFRRIPEWEYVAAK